MQIKVAESQNSAVNAYVSNSRGAVQQIDLPQGVDRATISDEALNAANKPQDTISLGEYLDGLSNNERAYFKAGILSKLGDSAERNLSVAAGAAEDTVQIAEQRGQHLDIDEVYLSIKQGFVPQSPTVDMMV